MPVGEPRAPHMAHDAVGHPCQGAKIESDRMSGIESPLAEPAPGHLFRGNNGQQFDGHDETVVLNVTRENYDKVTKNGFVFRMTITLCAHVKIMLRVRRAHAHSNGYYGLRTSIGFAGHVGIELDGSWKCARATHIPSRDPPGAAPFRL
jgi:hypothetical protein